MVSWTHDQTRQGLKNTSGTNILEKFLSMCFDNPHLDYCIDEHLGKLTYGDMKRGLIALYVKIKRVKSPNIGIMMASSASAYMAYFAVLLAGKTPVMINWTQGIREIRSCVDQTNVNFVISSKQLLTHLENSRGKVDYPFHLLFLEDVKENLNFLDKLKIGFFSFLSKYWLLKICGSRKITPQKIAVILFTSGSEEHPKSVPLTHKNLLSNQEGCREVFHLRNDDIMLSFLPPFHAYGFNACTLLPTLNYVRIVFASNPLNAKKNVDLIEMTGATFLGSTPLFLDYILQIAKKQNTKLSSLRLIVVGGEALKSCLYKELVQWNPSWVVLQGYGTTECSPVISVLSEETASYRKSVGFPIKNMDVIIVSPETYVPVSQRKSGLVLVKGDSVFPGYLNEDPNKGFITITGERWFRTGDRGYFNLDGLLFLEGRLSRFIKIAGEMVSLESIETILKKHFQLGDSLEPCLVACGIDDIEGKTKICLFTTTAITTQEVNAILKKAETSIITKVSFVHQLDKIPLLGIGKPNYAKLNKLARKLFG